MATATEIISSRTIGRDRNGKKLGTRLYQIDVPPDAALATPPAGFPAMGAADFPSHTDLQVDRIDIGYIPGSVGASQATVSYTTDRSGTYGGGIIPLEPGFAAWSISYRRAEVQVPHFSWKENAYTFPGPNGPEYVSTWVVAWEPHTESRIVYMRRVVLTSLNPDALDIIAEQDDKLHKIGARWVRFTSGDIDWQSPNRWLASYQWEYDPGTADVFGPLLTPNNQWPWHLTSVVPGVYQGVLYARPPFHQFWIDPSPDQETQPEIKVKCPNAAEANGYSALPGWVP